jgi:hypothetical protein
MGCSMKILTGIGTYEPEDFKGENNRKDAVRMSWMDVPVSLLSIQAVKSNVLRNIFRI